MPAYAGRCLHKLSTHLHGLLAGVELVPAKEEGDSQDVLEGDQNSMNLLA